MRVAILTHAFPPSRHANGKRPYYVARALADAGWEVDVITSHTGCAGTGAVEESFAGEQCRVLRLGDGFIGVLRRAIGRARLGKLWIAFGNGLIWPDFYRGWCRKAVRVSKSERYDRVLAFIFPASLYVAADRYGEVDSRWIFDLQEPVTPQTRQFPRRSPLQKLRAKELERVESKMLHRAGTVIFSAAANRRAYIDAGLVNDEAAGHVPYFYDAEVFRSPDPKIGELFEICYFGSFDWRGYRSPELFLESLAAFLRDHPDARGRTRFSYYGAWQAAHTEIVERLELGDVVQINAGVGYDEYLDLVRRSPILLLVVSATHNLFMPSKIVDYLGAGRPIIGFVPEGSEMHSLLLESSSAAWVVSEGSPDAGGSVIEKLWQAYSGSALEVAGSDERWSSVEQLPRYVELVAGGGDIQ